MAALLAEASANGTAVTCAGGQTSTTGASISDKGIVLSLRAMDRVIDLDPKARIVRAEPGVFVGELKRACAAHGLLLAPDPTSEEECTVGGAVACNASGARSLRYGATRPHVRALKVALADGSIVELRRPALEKNTVGYALAHDPVDWFVGSEGTLGVVVEVELGAAAAARAGDRARDSLRHRAGRARVRRRGAREPAACIRAASSSSTGARWPSRARRSRRRAGRRTPTRSCTSRRCRRAACAPALDEWLELAEQHGALADDVNVYEGEASLREARRVRHAVPATMNERGSPRRAARRPQGVHRLGGALRAARRDAGQGARASPTSRGSSRR